MSIKVPDEIQPMNGLDFGLMRDKYLIGGYHVVANTTLRDAIDESVRVEGMKVRVTSDGTEYVLESDLTTWTEVSSGGGTSRPEKPTGFTFRQYHNVIARALDQQADANINAWKALFPNITFGMLTQIPSDAGDYASTVSVLSRLHAHGIPAYPGFRLNASGGSASWFDPGKFEALAADFTALWAARADTSNMNFGFDIENYGLGDNGQLIPAVLTLLGKTREDLVIAMQPLIDAINAASAASGSNVIPHIHPTVQDPVTREPDQVMDILIENANGVAGVYSEEGFGNVESTRRRGDEGSSYDRLSGLLQLRELEFLYPKAEVRYGTDESVYRRWKGPIVDPANGTETLAGKIMGDGTWLFDTTRRDNSVFMTTAWYNGYPTLNALNDVAWVFEAGELNLGGSIYAYPPGSSSPGPTQLNGWVNDALNNSAQPGWIATRKGVLFPGQPGMLTSNTVGLRDLSPSGSGIFTGLTTWTVDIQFYLPYGSLGDRFPIVGSIQYNAKGWLLAYNQSLDRIELIVKTGSFTEAVLVVLNNPARDTIIRTQVGRNGSEWRHGTSRTSAVGTGEASTFLNIGLGWSSMDAGAGVRTSAAGLCWTGPLHVWTRFLSDANVAALTADGGRYPWGYSS